MLDPHRAESIREECCAAAGQVTAKPPEFRKSENPVDTSANQNYMAPIPFPSEGRFAIVTKRWARDAMDAAVSPDEAAAAYGKVVWSWRRDPGVNHAGPCWHGNGGKNGRSPGRARYKP